MRKPKCSDEKNARKEADLLITIKSFNASVHMDNTRIMKFIRRSGLPVERKMIDRGVWEIRVNLEKLSEDLVGRTYV